MVHQRERRGERRQRTASAEGEGLRVLDGVLGVQALIVAMVAEAVRVDAKWSRDR